ncbi:PilZ domain-containing protein [Methylomonas sp. MED-D]|uniref:Pilus assembly protein PilZ n=1 Tax=Methylomonas koyamae TaxID=702114 RepID=A0A177N284_9GAMM|nr:MULTISPECIES: PilZ domain-containing protein [Methylomonas]NJA06220.1 PilZ domain-containing protein [Methylococcaceae bacterium WWC4]MDT4328581.1 PilZ domain-containing protein [Methylomonas sp. MV1]OAI11320.1 pilus assembly protein PilZ [Methylomonas koyamae]OHX34345.1 pilus assembly protein PilZ [Methylomonas sp. LWB]WGS88183.1 PilZ domain-containing protein [Methylomonas sp. UP202]
MADEITEKRRYFRVNDTINLLHKVIDKNHVKVLSHVSDDVLSNCSLASALEVLNQEARLLAPRLERRDPDLFEYLKLLDTKINLIAQVLTSQSEQFSEHDTREVSLSATGLAFSNETPVSEGEVLELRMLLTSCMAVIVAYARVVHCKDISADNPERPYAVCVEYINMKEDDRELLIKHVVKKQLQQLRDKNET